MAENQTTDEYIQHHLTNLTYGQLPDGAWGFAHSTARSHSRWASGRSMSTRWAGRSRCGCSSYSCSVAPRATQRLACPAALQNGVEMIVEFIDEIVGSIFSTRMNWSRPWR